MILTLFKSEGFYSHLSGELVWVVQSALLCAGFGGLGFLCFNIR